MCMHVRLPTAVFNPFFSGIISDVTVHIVHKVLFGASLWTKEVVLWSVIYKKVKQSLDRPRGGSGRLRLPNFKTISI